MLILRVYWYLLDKYLSDFFMLDSVLNVVDKIGFVFLVVNGFMGR